MIRSLVAIFLLSHFSFMFSQSLNFGLPFSDNMVLQQGQKTKIWGTAYLDKYVKVLLYASDGNVLFEGKSIVKDNQWSIQLPRMEAQWNCSIVVSGTTDSIRINNVAIGEVWIAGGQSNMAWTLNGISDPYNDIEKSDNQRIRILTIPRVSYISHPDFRKWEWKVSSPEVAGSFSAIAYYFAKELSDSLKVPIGIIVCAHGSTYAECWISQNTLQSKIELRPILDRYKNAYLRHAEKYDSLYAIYEKEQHIIIQARKKGIKRPSAIQPMGPKHYLRPAGLYETMFQPLKGIMVKGVIWYQGEANAGRAEQYKILFPSLIEEWRKDLMNKELPFYFVQLSNYAQPGQQTWPELREAQLETWKKVKGTGMVVSIDCGEENNIHPKEKKKVAHRLSIFALNNEYGFKQTCCGPIYQSMKITGNKIILRFSHVGKGLQGNAEGFYICGKDREFKRANAIIKKEEVIVYSDSISAPIAVRYAWSNWSAYGLYNQEGFPASPFRTDNFDLITKDRK